MLRRGRPQLRWKPFLTHGPILRVRGHARVERKQQRKHIRDPKVPRVVRVQHWQFSDDRQEWKNRTLEPTNELKVTSQTFSAAIFCLETRSAQKSCGFLWISLGESYFLMENPKNRRYIGRWEKIIVIKVHDLPLEVMFHNFLQPEGMPLFVDHIQQAFLLGNLSRLSGPILQGKQTNPWLSSSICWQ